MPRASPLQRILHPLSVDEFADKYFQRRPLRIPGDPTKFDFLFRQSDFPLRLNRAKEIKAVFANLWEASIHAADIKHMIHAGATICVNGMEYAHPKLLNAARRIRSELNYAGKVSFRAYLSPPDQGFDLHFDARVATTLQIAGTKRWWFSTRPAVPFPTRNSGAVTRRNGPVQYEVPKLNTLRSIVLRPGDVLCLPAGVWHRAKGSTTSLALNMAFDHYGAGPFDSIVGMLEKRLMQDPAWREPLPVAVRHTGRKLPQPVAAVLRERIDMLQAELASVRDNEAALRLAWRMMVRPR